MRHNHSRTVRFAAVSTVTALALTATATSASAAHKARLAGDDRVGTAVEISKAAFSGADSVIVTRKDNFADALSASYLSSVENAPILLTSTASLDDATSAEITRQFQAADDNLGPGGGASGKTIFILGGPAAVSPAVQAQLAAAFPGATITRIDGEDRYATNRNIIEQVGASDIGTLGTSGRTAMITRGDNYPDALSVGPVSYQATFPVVLTRPSGLDEETKTLMMDYGIKYTLVVGGTMAVPDSVVAGMDMGMERVAGENREGTSVAVANFARTQLGFTQTAVAIGNSRNFPDALAGGPYGGVVEAPVLMIRNPDALGPEVTAFLQAQAGTIQTVVAVGGPAAVSETVLDAAADIVNGS